MDRDWNASIPEFRDWKIGPGSRDPGIRDPGIGIASYLGVFFVKSRNFKCSFAHAKKSFYCALNAVFGKIGRIASIPVVLELVAKKCLPILLYGLEAVPVNRTDQNSLDFAINRFVMKLFNTGNIDVVEECKMFFKFQSVTTRLSIKSNAFIQRFGQSQNSLCQLSLNLF